MMSSSAKRVQILHLKRDFEAVGPFADHPSELSKIIFFKG